MKISKTIRKFLELFAINSLLSFILNIVIWEITGHTFTLKGRYLDIDFYNTLCGTFGITGLVIALYQIAALRNEEQVISDTRVEVLKQNFIKRAGKECSTVHEQMLELQQLINNDTYSKQKIKGYIDRINSAVNIMERLDNSQKDLTETPIIECGKCIPLLMEIRANFEKVLTDTRIRTFKKHSYNLKMQFIIKCISECETKLN